MKRNMANSQSAMSRKAMSDMIDFIIDLNEAKAPGSHRKLCKVLGSSKNNFKPLKKALNEYKNWDPSIGLFENKKAGTFTFHGQDITKETKMMTDAWVIHNYDKFGFILGDALIRHSADAADKKVADKK